MNNLTKEEQKIEYKKWLETQSPCRYRGNVLEQKNLDETHGYVEGECQYFSMRVGNSTTTNDIKFRKIDCMVMCLSEDERGYYRPYNFPKVGSYIYGIKNITNNELISHNGWDYSKNFFKYPTCKGSDSDFHMPPLIIQLYISLFLLIFFLILKKYLFKKSKHKK